MQLRPLMIVLLASACIVSSACEKQETTPPDTGGDASATAEPETPEQKCTRMLERFGPDVAEAEMEGCQTALTTSNELALCREAGVETEYLQCFDSCVAGVQLDPAEYNPADEGTSPIVNCVTGCSSTNCQ